MVKIRRVDQEVHISFHNTNRFNFLMVEKLNKAFPDLGVHAGGAFVFDFTGINFIDTTGFKYLLFLIKKGMEHNFNYRICHLSEEVKELIENVDIEFELDPYLVEEPESCI